MNKEKPKFIFPEPQVIKPMKKEKQPGEMFNKFQNKKSKLTIKGLV